VSDAEPVLATTMSDESLAVNDEDEDESKKVNGLRLRERRGVQDEDSGDDGR
jgi:hypothetical protein